jgi:hypothetical protein
VRGICKGITDVIFCILSFLINHSVAVAVDVQFFYCEPLAASFGEVFDIGVSEALASVLEIAESVEGDC